MKISKFYKNIIFVCLIYFAIGIVYTWPVFFNFDSVIFAQKGDPFGTIYKFWQFANQIKPISYIFPEQPLYRLYTQFLNYIFSEIAVFNILSIFTFVFSAIPFYLLAKKITKNTYAAFLAGFIVAICPYRVAQLAQHVNLANIGFLGFFVYFLTMLFDKFNSKNIILVSLFFLLTLFDCYTYGIFALVILVIFIGLKIIFEAQAKTKTILSKKEIYAVFGSILVILALISLLIIMPIYSPKNTSAQKIERSKEELVAYSAYGRYYLLPSPQNPFWGNKVSDYFDEKIKQLGTNYTEQTNYLGYIVLILSSIYCIYFIWNYKKINLLQKYSTYFFILIGAIGVYFSFSFPIYVGNVNVSLAEKVYNLIPFLRVYSRFGLLVILALAMLASMGAMVCLNKVKNQYWNIVFIALICILVFLEYSIWPQGRIQSISANNIPKVYQYLPKDNCELIEYPFFSEDAPQGYEYLIWKMYHNCGLINEDYVKFDESKIFRETVRDINSSSDIETLKEYGVDYIIINKDLFLDTKEFWLNAETINNSVPNLSNLEDLEKVGEWDNKMLYKIK